MILDIANYLIAQSIFGLLLSFMERPFRKIIESFTEPNPLNLFAPYPEAL